MVWGLGEKAAWGKCPKVKTSAVSGVKTDGSGVIRAGEQSLATDFSKTSGAELLLVWGGPGAGGAVKNTGKLRVGQVEARGTVYDRLTLTATGEHPEAKADGKRLIIGGQSVTFDGKNIVFAK